MEGKSETTVLALIRRTLWLALLSAGVLLLALLSGIASFVAQHDAEVPSSDPTKIVAAIIATLAALGAIALFVFLVAQFRRDPVISQRYGILLGTIVLVGVASAFANHMRFDTDSDLARDVAFLTQPILFIGGIWAFVRNDLVLGLQAAGLAGLIGVAALLAWWTTG